MVKKNPMEGQSDYAAIASELDEGSDELRDDDVYNIDGLAEFCAKMQARGLGGFRFTDSQGVGVGMAVDVVRGDDKRKELVFRTVHPENEESCFQGQIWDVPFI